GGGAGDAGGGNGGSAPAHVLDDEILPELVRQRRRQHARELVGRPAGGIRHDEGDDAARILLGEAQRRESENPENRHNRTDDTPHRTLLLRRLSGQLTLPVSPATRRKASCLRRRAGWWCRGRERGDDHADRYA